MATVEEAWDVVEYSLDSAEFELIIHDTDSYLDALSEAAAVIPSTYANNFRTLHLVKIGSLRRVGEEIWRCPFRYGTEKEAQQQQEEEGETQSGAELPYDYSFEIGGSTQRVTHSKATIGEFFGPTTSAATDFKQGINVKESGPEGADIYVPSYQFTETHRFLDVVVTPAFKANIYAHCAKVNSAPFKGFAAGEVLFIGATGGKKGLERWEISYRFAAIPNISGLTIGSIPNILKKGHEYLWVKTMESVDSSTNLLIFTPIQANVEKMYDVADLNNLGI